VLVGKKKREGCTRHHNRTEPDQRKKRRDSSATYGCPCKPDDVDNVRSRVVGGGQETVEQKKLPQIATRRWIAQQERRMLAPLTMQQWYESRPTNECENVNRQRIRTPQRSQQNDDHRERFAGHRRRAMNTDGNHLDQPHQ
jgi:hypothetical protein